MVTTIYCETFTNGRRCALKPLLSLKSHDPRLRQKDAIRVLEIGARLGGNFEHITRTVKYTNVDPNVKFGSAFLRQLQRNPKPSVLTPLKKATPADEAKPSDGGKDPWDDTAEPNSSVEIEDKDAKEACTLAEATTGETQDTYDTVMPASCSAPAKRLHEETDEQEEKDQEKGSSDEPPPKAPPGRRPAFKPKPGVQAKRRTTTPTPPR
ncbi:hypothetical protein HPB49_012419 [Dermacentor silvarum]|uniref:Uncharacterized protein n=1 Tax=Dermacentor silvarum TaxID=543639 RepID=A0ACB8C970_DERSI|nr:hypothetical protein HPB49_012419 [Dermacentor silvarum]